MNGESCRPKRSAATGNKKKQNCICMLPDGGLFCGLGVADLRADPWLFCMLKVWAAWRPLEKMMWYKVKMLFKGFRLLLRDPRTFFRKMHGVLRPMREDYRKRLDMNLRDWLKYHQKEIVFDKCHWMGVKTLKNPLDTWIYQEIIYEVQPDVIVEIGSAYGGSTVYFSNLLDLIGKGTVISVDIKRKQFNVRHPRIVEVTGDSSADGVVAEVSQLCQGKTVLVMHDGDHRKRQVLKDLENYSKLVTVNSYLIVEDGIVDLFKPGDDMGQWYEGPLLAVEEFLIANTDFVVDTDRERYILTYNPKGFLKRVR